MNSPEISIIIPYKNTAEFIGETLQSICAQSFLNWELLIVNDHSVDDSQRIVSDFAQKDPRIISIDNQGTGIIDALQTGYNSSSGNFITRMDSDDLMTPNKLTVMVEQLLEHGPGYIALGAVKYFSDQGIGEGFKSYEEWLNRLSAKGTNFQEIYKECVIPSPCWMVYRNDFEKAGGFNPKDYPEDYDLAFRFYQSGLKCIPTKSILHHWRDYPTRSSRTDSNYADNSFLHIKTKYFLKLHKEENRPLVLWGAGKKGKDLAKILNDKQIPFTWVCDNPKKVGKIIYGHKMVGYSVIGELDNPQNIVAVANSEAQIEISKYFEKIGKLPMQDYFFFC